MDFNFFIGALLWLIALFTGITAYCICLAVVERVVDGELRESMRHFLPYMKWLLISMMLMTVFAISAGALVGLMAVFTKLATR